VNGISARAPAQAAGAQRGIVDPTSHHVSYWREAEGAAKRRGVVLQYVEIQV